jgi:hypothetical protein
MSSRTSAPMNIDAFNQGRRSGGQGHRSRLVFPGTAPTAGPGMPGSARHTTTATQRAAPVPASDGHPHDAPPDSPAGFARGRFSAGKRPLPGAVRQSCTAASIVSRRAERIFGGFGTIPYRRASAPAQAAGRPSRNRHAAGARGLAGSCLECFRTGRPVTAGDLGGPAPRWPRFAQAAAQAGFRTVEAPPIRLRDQVIGALNLFAPGPARSTCQRRHRGIPAAATAPVRPLDE